MLHVTCYILRYCNPLLTCSIQYFCNWHKELIKTILYLYCATLYNEKHFFIKFQFFIITLIIFNYFQRIILMFFFQVKKVFLYILVTRNFIALFITNNFIFFWYMNFFLYLYFHFKISLSANHVTLFETHDFSILI